MNGPKFLKLTPLVCINGALASTVHSLISPWLTLRTFYPASFSICLSTERLVYCCLSQSPLSVACVNYVPHLITLYQHLLCFHSVVIKCGTFLPKCLEVCLETSVYSAALFRSPYVLKTAWPGSRNISAKLERVTQRQAKSSLEKR